MFLMCELSVYIIEQYRTVGTVPIVYISYLVITIIILCPPYISKMYLYADDTILSQNTTYSQAWQAACSLALFKYVICHFLQQFTCHLIFVCIYILILEARVNKTSRPHFVSLFL